MTPITVDNKFLREPFYSRQSLLLLKLDKPLISHEQTAQIVTEGSSLDSKNLNRKMKQICIALPLTKSLTTEWIPAMMPIKVNVVEEYAC